MALLDAGVKSRTHLDVWKEEAGKQIQPAGFGQGLQGKGRQPDFVGGALEPIQCTVLLLYTLTSIRMILILPCPLCAREDSPQLKRAKCR